MITIRINNSIYSNFKSINVALSMETLSGAFDAVATIDQFSNFPIKIGDNVEILVNDQKVLTGFIEELEPRYSADSHEISLSGRSKTADVIDSSLVDNLEIKGDITLKAVIEKILTINSITGINVIEATNIDPFVKGETISAESGEGLFDIIDKYCQKRQVLATTNGDGDIVLTRSSADNLNAQLIFRTKKSLTQNITNQLITNQTNFLNKLSINKRENNILSANAFYSTKNRYYKYIVRTQDNMNGINDLGISINGLSSVSKKGEAIDDLIRTTRSIVISADDANTTETAKNKAIWEANIRKARTFEYTCNVQGFMANNNDLWLPNKLVKVEDNFMSINDFYIIKSVAFNYSLDGSITQIKLVNKNSYTLIEPKDEKKDDDLLASLGIV